MSPTDVAAASNRLMALGHRRPAVGVLVGDRTHTAADPDERFWIGSLTKTFTGALLALLAVDATVRLGDTVARWVPEATRLAPGLDEVTLESLSCHRSGLTRLRRGTEAAADRVLDDLT